MDDPVWRAYCIHKRKIGTKALSELYQVWKEEAEKTGKPDFLISGNDFTGFTLGYARTGELDMVSMEISDSRGLGSGTRGFMLPPVGSYVPAYKFAREFAKSRFVSTWMYQNKKELQKKEKTKNLARVLFYQGLANHVFNKTDFYQDRTIGHQDVVKEFNSFVVSIKSILGNRIPAEEIGVYYSSSSQLAEFTPGGTLDLGDQEHMFAHWGWGTVLQHLHYTFRSIPEWKLTKELLNKIRILIIPNSIVFDKSDIPLLKDWIKAGGNIIVTGKSGSRGGERDNFNRNKSLCLNFLTGISDYEKAEKKKVRKYGKGIIYYIKESIGKDYYMKEKDRDSIRNEIKIILNTIKEKSVNQTPYHFSDGDNVPYYIGLTRYEDKEKKRLFIDVNNTMIDIKTDKITPVEGLSFKVSLPSYLQGKKIKFQCLSPHSDIKIEIKPVHSKELFIKLKSKLEFYTSLLIEEK